MNTYKPTLSFIGAVSIGVFFIGACDTDSISDIEVDDVVESDVVESDVVGNAETDAQLRVVIHDKPSVEVAEVWVAFDEVLAEHDELGWIIVSDTPLSVDLLSLQGGVYEQLGLTAMPAGEYSQVRLGLTDAWVVVGDDTLPLDVPSGMTSGLKIGHDFTMPECGVVTLSLDWDVGAHLVQTGAGDFKLRPTLTVEETIDEAGCE